MTTEEHRDNHFNNSSNTESKVKTLLRNFAAPFFLQKILTLFHKHGYAAAKYVAANFHLTSWVNQYFLKKYYPLQHGQIGLISCWGIGDTVMVAGLANYLVTSGKVKSVALLVKPGHDYIAGLFPGIAQIYTIHNFKSYLEPNINYPQLPPQILAPDQYFYAHFFNWEMAGLVGHKKVHLLDAYRAVLKLDHKLELLKPRPLFEAEVTAANFIFENYSLEPEKTVFIAPSAVSILSFPESFWNALYEKFLAEGFKVVINAPPDGEQQNKNIINLSMPFDQLIAFANLCAGVVSVRSGLCDLLSLYNINLIVLYPDMDWLGGNFFDGCSINAMWSSGNTQEMVIDQADEITAKNIIAKLITK